MDILSIGNSQTIRDSRRAEVIDIILGESDERIKGNDWGVSFGAQSDRVQNFYSNEGAEDYARNTRWTDQ